MCGAWQSRVRRRVSDHSEQISEQNGRDMADRDTPSISTLICLPFAGAGASFFHPWQERAPSGLRVLAVQLPGRERLIDEEPYRTVRQAADGLLPELAKAADGRVVLYGHSLGAVLAFELALRLAEAGTDQAGLIVGGSPGPWTRRQLRATGLPDDEFVLRVQDFAGYAHEALLDPELRELILPTLRADVEMHENYRPLRDTRPLPIPVVSLRGAEDDLVTAEQAREWAAATAAEFSHREVPGGHMFPTAGPEPVLRAALDLLAAGGRRDG